MQYYSNYTIFSEIKINEIKDETKLDLITSFRNVKSHVGIAAAVTAYARIEMMQYKPLLTKLGLNLYYTDTDSIFIDGELPSQFIGNELGLMKDELKGGLIKKLIFWELKNTAILITMT